MHSAGVETLHVCVREREEGGGKPGKQIQADAQWRGPRVRSLYTHCTFKGPVDCLTLLQTMVLPRSSVSFDAFPRQRPCPLDICQHKGRQCKCVAFVHPELAPRFFCLDGSAEVLSLYNTPSCQRPSPVEQQFVLTVL